MNRDTNTSKQPDQQLEIPLPRALGPFRFPTHDAARTAAFSLLTDPDATLPERVVYADKRVFGDRFAGYAEQQPGCFVSAESAIGVDTVLLRTRDPLTGEELLQECNILKKSVIKIAPHDAAKAQAARLLHLRQCGVPIVEIYALKDGTIYEECVEETTVDPLSDIRKRQGDWQEYLSQLCSIAATLDLNGYRTTHFVNDLVFDGRTFRYVDGGSDLGEPDEEPVHHARTTLLRMFDRHETFVRERYDSHYGSLRRVNKHHVDEYFEPAVSTSEKFDIPKRAAA